MCQLSFEIQSANQCDVLYYYMKDQSYQKHKTIIGKSNEQFYEIQNRQKGINITIFDPNTLQQGQCTLTAEELLNKQYLPEKLKNLQNWMYEFAEIKQSGRYEFIQINPDRSIIITFRPVNQQEGFSVTLISKIVPKKDVPIELHSLSIVVGQIVEERMITINRDIFDKIEKRIDQTMFNKQQKRQKISFKLWAVVLFVILTVLLVYKNNQQKGPDYRKQINKIKRDLSKLNKYKHHNEKCKILFQGQSIQFGFKYENQYHPDKCITYTYQLKFLSGGNYQGIKYKNIDADGYYGYNKEAETGVWHYNSDKKVLIIKRKHLKMSSNQFDPIIDNTPQKTLIKKFSFQDSQFLEYWGEKLQKGLLADQ